MPRKTLVKIQANPLHVFSNYREAFTAPAARLLRKEKTVRAFVRKRQPIQDRDVGKDVPVLCALLRAKAFDSDELAREALADLSRAWDARRRSGKRQRASSCHVAAVNQRSLVQYAFKAQHRVLCTVQRLLENSIFSYLKERHSEVLKEGGWSCAEACELNKWLLIVAKHAQHSPHQRAALHRITSTINQIRHAAVHRHHITTEAFLQQIHAAWRLVEILGDGPIVAKLKDFYDQIVVQSTEILVRTDQLQERLQICLAEVEQQRGALAKKECDLMHCAASEEMEMIAKGGEAMEKLLNILQAM